MRKFSTKTGVVITTYTQKEVSDKMDVYVNDGDEEGCVIFLDDVKSFNKSSGYYITENEVVSLVGLEEGGFYTNYKGCPLGVFGEIDFKLFYRNPFSSLKSAFEVMAPEFDYKKDFFHIKIEK